MTRKPGGARLLRRFGSRVMSLHANVPPLPGGSSAMLTACLSTEDIASANRKIMGIQGRSGDSIMVLDSLQIQVPPQPDLEVERDIAPLLGRIETWVAEQDAKTVIRDMASKAPPKPRSVAISPPSPYLAGSRRWKASPRGSAPRTLRATISHRSLPTTSTARWISPESVMAHRFLHERPCR